jgi:hypothetical protein
VSTIHTTQAAALGRRTNRRLLAITASALIATGITVPVLAAAGTSHPRAVPQTAPAGNFMGLHYPGTGAPPIQRVAPIAPGHCTYIRPEQRCLDTP